MRSRGAPEGPPPIAVALVVLATAIAGACGKKGPPLPPLVRLPVAPINATADRFGSDVRLQFTVPAENTDRTRPANIERIDVYGLTASVAVTDDQLLKQGTKVGSVAVKAPRDPNLAIDPDEPQEEFELEGQGVDQGVVAEIDERLTPALLLPVPLAADGTRAPAGGGASGADAVRPLLGPIPNGLSRVYVAVGINKSGRRGPPSRRLAIPVVPPPPPPSGILLTVEETSIAVSWTPPRSVPPIQPPATDGLLAARFIGMSQPVVAYHVYALPPPSGSAPPGAARETRLTRSPQQETRYADNRIEWGVERCYAVRAVETLGALAVESERRPPVCTTPVDTFPPAAPVGLTPVASEGAINLIWDPNSEADLAGYIVLRSVAPDTTFTRVTPSPIAETSFSDKVQPGVRYVYAVQAVDRVGNVSAMSSRIEETAR